MFFNPEAIMRKFLAINNFLEIVDDIFIKIEKYRKYSEIVQALQ